MKLSIIIPVYRTQSTLSRCMDSILRQSYTDYEVILVDDGSPDDCPQLCDEYARRDARVTVVHKTNGGLSDARNKGIERARGEYVTFVDSDDALSEDTLRLLMRELQDFPDTDILEYPIMERVGHPTKERLLSFTPKDYHDAVDYWLGEKAYGHTYACNKIYRRELFRDIRFPEGRSFEDVLTMPRLIGLVPAEHGEKAPCIRVANVGMYLYMWNDSSITATARYEDLSNLYSGHVSTMAALFRRMEGREEEVLERYGGSLEQFLLCMLNVLIDMYDSSGIYERPEELLRGVEWLRSRRTLTSYKLRLLAVLGYRQVCRLFHVFHAVRRWSRHWRR